MYVHDNNVIRLLAWTHFDAELAKELTGWSTDAEGGQALAEFAGRACYQSWHKPNPKTATNESYLAHINEVGHFSVLEHGTATFYFQEVPRSFTHELIRHRHFSYSQLSQRYVNEHERDEPPVYPADSDMRERQRILDAHDAVMEAYRDILGWRMEAGQGVKQAREAARSVLMNAHETKIVVTGNYRAWGHFIAMRATEQADLSMSVIAIGVLRELQRIAPNVFNVFKMREAIVRNQKRVIAYVE